MRGDVVRLSIVKTKNSVSFRVIKSIYVNGKNTSKIVETLGTERYLREKYPDQDPYEYAKNYVEELNRLEKEGKTEIIARFSNSKLIPKEKSVYFRGGYLFLQRIYHDLGLDKLLHEISQKYKFRYDISDILSRLLFTRILEPGSKVSSFEAAKNYIEPPSFKLHDVYRALSVLAIENHYIQEKVYKNSKRLVKRNDKILYYDCTNYFFEIEKEDEFKKYGLSKEHRPNPLVQMGLFLDASGFPLAFSLNPGNTNEQTTLIPLEKQVLKDFDLSKCIICTDAGLSSITNRLFNNRKNRAFITTQSIKKLKAYLKEWALDKEGWSLEGSNKTYNIEELDMDNPKEYSNIYYKTRWINEGGLEQQLIVSFSLKYKAYLKELRSRHILRAEEKIKSPSRMERKRTNGPDKYIAKTSITEDGEIAEKTLYEIDGEMISHEETYDGFYGVCTNLEANVGEILQINKQRWQIEEAFRTLKTEFEARPVHLSREDRIKAHFLTCFLALLIYKILEYRIKQHEGFEEITIDKIIAKLNSFNFTETKGEGYIPNYTRDDLTDVLHEEFGFRTDYEIITKKDMKRIIKETRK